MELKFKCHSCGKYIFIRFLNVGEIAQCLHCGAKNVVPATGEPLIPKQEIETIDELFKPKSENESTKEQARKRGSYLFLKLVIGAFVAGFIYAGYQALMKWGYEWAEESGGTKVELIGTIGMVPEERMGYINIDGAYNTATEQLVLSSQGQQYLLIFKKDSDISALVEAPSANKNTLVIQGKSIAFDPSESYKVIGDKSSYKGFIPVEKTIINGRVDYIPVKRIKNNDRKTQNFIKDKETDYYKIIVSKIIHVK